MCGDSGVIIGESSGRGGSILLKREAQPDVLSVLMWGLCSWAMYFHGVLTLGAWGHTPEKI